MNCESAADLINRRIDDELTDAERVRLDEHLAACPVCRELSHRMIRVAGVLSAFRSDNQAMLDGRASSRTAADYLKRVVGWAVPAALATAACLAVLVHVASRYEQPAGSPVIHVVQHRPAVPAVTHRRPVVQLVGESRDKYLAAEVDSGVQNVRLIYVFPVARKTQPGASSPSSQPNQNSS